MPVEPKPPFAQYFGLKNGRTSFLVNPDQDPKLLFGAEHQSIFSELYSKVEERSYATLGYKAVLWGDFGLGKTQFLKHFRYCVSHPSEHGTVPLAVYPVYIQLHALNSKAPFADFAGELIRAIGTEELGAITTDYVNTHGMAAISALGSASSESIAIAFEVIARFPGRARQHAIRWICGEKLSPADAANIDTASGRISGQVSKGKEFGSILQILALMIAKVRNKVLTYLIDEVERLGNVTDINAYAQWMDCMRGITILEGLGLILAVGAQTRDELPSLLREDEIESRIGPLGYVQLQNFAESSIRDFVMQALNELRDCAIASTSQSIELSPDQAKIWPFDEAGLQAFVEYCYSSPLGNRPREILNALQEVAGRLYRENKHTIDEGLVSRVLSAR